MFACKERLRGVLSRPERHGLYSLQTLYLPTPILWGRFNCRSRISLSDRLLPVSADHVVESRIVRHSPPSRTHTDGPRRSWFVALASFMLIALSLGSYFYHRRQLDSIAARYRRLVVAGPESLCPGMPAAYGLMATTVTGEPLPESVEWSLSSPDGRRLVDRKEATDDQGQLMMIVPSDMDLPTRSHGPTQLSVIAGGAANPATADVPLAIRPHPCLTRLWLDRRAYRPGDTVYYRSLTFSVPDVKASPDLLVEFEILSPKSVALPGSQAVGLTDRGVGSGSFHLPKDLPAGTYTLVARGWDDAFAEERRTFDVSPGREMAAHQGCIAAERRRSFDRGPLAC